MDGALSRLLKLTARTPEASTVPEPHGRPGGPGLWRHKGMEAPPYVQHVAGELMKKGHSESEAYHMAVGIVKDWAKGHDGHGHKVHADVRAAATANVAKWEELRAKARALTAAKHAKKKVGTSAPAEPDPAALERLIALAVVPPAASFLKNGTLTGPGARPIYGHQLYHVPSQTVSASPPLPAQAGPPSPAELTALSGEIENAGDSPLLLGASKHVAVAAVHVKGNDWPGALRMLRAAMTGVRAARQEHDAGMIPAANVFSASLLPAEASSAQAVMAEGQRTREKFVRLQQEVAMAIDRIRRANYHALYGNLYQQGRVRFSGDGPAGRALRLAAGAD